MGGKKPVSLEEVLDGAVTVIDFIVSILEHSVTSCIGAGVRVRHLVAQRSLLAIPRGSACAARLSY